jgi:hypothetical protein
MKKIIITSIVIFIITIALFLLVLSKQRNSDKETNSHIENLRVENILLKEGFFHSYDFKDFEVNFQKSIYTYNGDSINFNNISESNPTIFLLIDHGGCSDCYLNNITAIKDFYEKTKINTVIGIMGMDKRSFRAFAINNNIESYCYLLPNGFYDGFHLNSIIYFVLDNFSLCCFYSPSYVLPSLTESYLLKIEDLYSSSKHF